MAQVGNLIIVGTYEEFVLGYAIVPDEFNEKKLTLVQTFACHSHRASVRSLAVGGVNLASGSTDETIRLYNIVNQVESGLLNHHAGCTVNALAFTADGTHLMSGGADGTIAVTRTGSWFVEKSWTGTHSGSAVTGISVHPSGKLALSIGADNRIVTWNLVKGRKAYITNVASRCRNGWGVGDVQWSPSGSCYAVFMSTHAEVYSVAIAGVTHTITCSNRVTAIAFLEDDILLVGEESGEASIHKLKPLQKNTKEGEKKEIARFQAHDRRVKCAKNLGSVSEGERNAIQFVTAGGSGRICLWELENSEVVKLCEVGTGCRVTCMLVVDLEKELQLKKEGDSAKDAAQAKMDIELAKTRKTVETARKRRLSSVRGAASSSNNTSSSSKVQKSSKNSTKVYSKLHKTQPATFQGKKTKKAKAAKASQWVVTQLE